MKVLAIILAVVLVAESKVVPTSQPSQPESQTNTLADLINQAQASISTMAKQVQEQLNISNQTNLADAIKAQTNEFTKNVEDYAKRVSEEVKARSPEVVKAWDDLKGKLSKAMEDINAQIPNAQEQVTQLQEKFQQGLQTVVSETDKATKVINESKVKEDIAKVSKDLVDIALQATQNLNKQLQQAAKQ